MEDRKFPIGPLTLQDTYSPTELTQFIDIIAAAPAKYRHLTQNLTPNDLAKTYREGSWTVQQLVHHVADMQLLHFFRMKKALTEPSYEVVTLVDMNAWATTPEALTAPIEDSLLLFEGVHRRYAYLAKSLSKESLAISYFHPVRQIRLNQAQALAMSAWHVRHHLAHIQLALGLPLA